MKTYKQYLLPLFLLFFFTTAMSQECGFDIQRERLRQNPNFLELERAAEAKILNAIENSGRFNGTAGNVLTIPVVVHVLHLGEDIGMGTNIADAQIQSSIDNLNDFYRGQTPASPLDFEIQFALAQRDPNCIATTGINRIDASGVPNYTASGVSFNSGAGANEIILKDLSRWPETDYFNIWIVTEINGNNGGSGFQGYANFYFGNAYEGSVMMHTVFGYDPANANTSWPLNFARDNSTVVHEAGHYFHLYHTFQGDEGGGTCPENNVVGVDSDGCADTVPHRRETSTCPVNNFCSGGPWADPYTINNIMGYYSCADKMTNDQKTRIRAAMEGTSIANSKGAEPVDLNYVAPVAVCGTNATSTNNAGIISVELNDLTFTSFSSASDGGNIDDSANCSSYFEIDTAVANTLNIGMFPVNFQQLGVWVDWNDDGDFNDDAEQQHISQDIPEDTSIPIVLSYPATIPYGDYVRIRLITDLDDRYGVGLINSPCYTSLTFGQSEDYAIYVQPAPVTYTYNDSWSPSDPVGNCTSRDDIVVASGTANIFANTDCNTLTVDSGAALTINAGVNVCATTLNLNSTSQLFSSLISDGTITGTVNYNRYTSQVGPVGTNDLISAPLSGQTFGSFALANTNLAASGTIRAFAPYNTSTGVYQNYDTNINDLTLITSGIGYRAGTEDGSTLTFTGMVNSSDVLDVPISDAVAGFAWNLIGNPYPSYLDFNTFFQLNKSEFDSDSAFQAIYGYDGDASNGWTIWNQATIDEESITELIAPGQGFFVKAKSGGGLVDFTSGMRMTGASDDFIEQRQQSQVNNNTALCRLNLTSATNNASTQIYFIEGTTRGLDIGYDAASYRGNASEFSIFSNLVEDNTGLDIAIQSLPYSDSNDVVVPLGIKASAGHQLQIGVDAVSTLSPDINVYLEDTVGNIVTLLNNSDYIFTPSADLNGTGRFYIRYASETLSTNNNYWSDLLIYTSSNPKTITIKGQLRDATKANLYNIQGGLIYSEMLDHNNTSNTMDISRISAGIYVIQLLNKNSTKTQKLVIR